MRVAILGVGLIGGSIGIAAKRRAGATVCGFDPNPQVLEEALRLGAIDTTSAGVAEAVEGARVVFVAAPVGRLGETVAAALAAAGSDTVVSDVGSTKRNLASVGADERFIGGHPLAGAETSGVAHAREDLFDGATWYLTPAQGSTAGVLYERLHRLLIAIGARPAAIDADTHDRLMANVSHLPHVLANVLVAQVAGLLGRDGSERLPAVGPSFRDATRVAGANTSMWTDIYLANADALIVAIDELGVRLAGARAAIAAGDGDAIAVWNDSARADRAALLGAGLAGRADGEAIHELHVAVPNRPGAVAEIALALGRGGVNILDMALAPSPQEHQGEVTLWIAGGETAVRAHDLIAALGFPIARA